MTIINDQQALQLTDLIDQPQQTQRAFWTAKVFHGYIAKNIRSNNEIKNRLFSRFFYE
jgi:hypothetical protein